MDLVGKKEEDYQQLLRSHFPNIEIIVSKKADSIFPIVGAASICAKVTRDKRMREWEFEEDGFGVLAKEMGCGYPNGWFLNKCPIFHINLFIQIH